MRFLPFSPILGKELIQIASNRRSFILKCVFLGITSAISSLMLLVTQDSDQTKIGQILFNTVAYIEMFAIILYLPIITAGVVSGEQEAKTMPLLFLTKLTPWNIAQDKALSRIMQILYVCILTWPLMFCSLLFGGITELQIMTVLGYLTGLALICSAAGILCSSFLKGYAAALVVSFVLVILSFMVPFLFLFSGGQQGIFYAFAYCPLWAIGLATQSGWFSGSSFGPSAGVYAGIGLGLYLGSVCIAAMRVAKARKGKGKGSGLLTTFNSIIGGFMQAFIAGSPAERPTWNAIYWKNCSLRSDGLKRVMCRLPILMVLIYMVCLAGALLVHGSAGGQAISFIAASFGFPLILILNCVLAANTFTGERKSETLDILLTTRLEGRSIVRGTVLAHIRFSIAMWLIPMATLTVGCALRKSILGYSAGACLLVGAVSSIAAAFIMLARSWGKGVRRTFEAVCHGVGVVTLLTVATTIVIVAIENDATRETYDASFSWAGLMWLLHCVFFSALGVRISIWSKTSTKSIATTLGIAAGLCIVVPIFVGIFEELTGLDELSMILMSASPSGSLIMAISPEGMTQHPYVIIPHLLIYGFATAYLYRNASTGFNRIVGRQ